MEKYVTPQMIVDALPINKGDTLLIASDIQRLCWGALQSGENFNFQKLINLLQENVGKEGTLLFPTYNWNFCHGVTFDYHKTKSLTGSLSQIALERNDFIRTKHAIYSFAVWGKDAQFLYEMNDKNSFAGNTPFDYLYKKDHAKMIMIDVDLTHSFTFVHYVEEVNKVPYRFLKDFISEYVDENKQKTERTYSMYVRDLNINGNVDFSGLEKLLLEKNLMKEVQVEYSKVFILNFANVYCEIEKDIQFNQSKNIVHIG